MNVISFSAKMIGKWPTEPIISDFPIFGLCPQFNKSNILRRPKEYATQKVARPNGKGKRKGKGKKRNSELLIAKKQTNQTNSKFWLMRMHQIQILQLLLNL